jgi:hypothetical protein
MGRADAYSATTKRIDPKRGTEASVADSRQGVRPFV